MGFNTDIISADTIYVSGNSITPKYKVYTALLTQSGGDNLQETDNIPLTIGVTYMIKVNGALRGDFTNVGAPNNDDGTYFVATGINPNQWGQDSVFYNTGAPVVTVLENTIGNVWFTYDSVGIYDIKSDNLFIQDKTFFNVTLNSGPIGGNLSNFFIIRTALDVIVLTTKDDLQSWDDFLYYTPIEIRVYN